MPPSRYFLPFLLLVASVASSCLIDFSKFAVGQPCEQDEECTSGLRCAEKEGVKCCGCDLHNRPCQPSSPHCPAEETCFFGNCWDTQRNDKKFNCLNRCANGESCKVQEKENSLCLSTQQTCSNDSDCPPQQTCKNEGCVARSCSFTNPCPTRFPCGRPTGEEGTCVALRCENFEDCAPFLICKKPLGSDISLCILPTCTSDGTQPCPPQMKCNQGTCQPEQAFHCTSSDECPSQLDLVCYRGICLKNRSL